MLCMIGLARLGARARLAFRSFPSVISVKSVVKSLFFGALAVRDRPDPMTKLLPSFGRSLVRQRIGHRSWRGRGVAEDMHIALPIKHNARRRDRQPVAPFVGEDLGAREKGFRQPDAPGIMIAKSPQRDDGQAALACLKADVGAVEMETQCRVELQTGITAHDQ